MSAPRGSKKRRSPRRSLICLPRVLGQFEETEVGTSLRTFIFSMSGRSAQLGLGSYEGLGYQGGGKGGNKWGSGLVT